MAQVDVHNLFSDDQAVTGTAIGTNVIDLKATNTLKNMGAGTPVYCVFVITTAVAASGGASTTTFSIESDDNTGLSSATVHWSSSAIAKATLVAGYKIIVPLPVEKTYQQYLGVRYTVATNNWTSGAVTAYLTATPDSADSYVDNITIS
jgi:hypothetical protein